METRANYLLVGSFVLILVFGLIGFVIWLAKVEFDTQFARYDTYFDGSVTGLQTGSPVKYRGITVGEVIAVQIDPDNVARVQVTIEIRSDTPIREDTVATLAIQGLAGGVFLQLTGGTHDAEPLVAKEGQRHPVIASRPFALEKLISGIDQVLLEVADLLNEQNREAFAQTLRNVAEITEAIASQKETFSSLLGDAKATGIALRDAAESVQALSAKLDSQLDNVFSQTETTLGAFEAVALRVDTLIEENADKVDGTVEDLRLTAQSFRRLADEGRALLAENREPLRDFTQSGLYELTTLLTEIRELVIGIKRVTKEVERDPARFLFGDQQQGYEAGFRNER